MKQHKWHKEIKAWADGAEIELRSEIPYTLGGGWTKWRYIATPNWDNEICEYRIKPHLKEPKYLYVYARGGLVNYIYDEPRGWAEDFVGKIKLEDEK